MGSIPSPRSPAWLASLLEVLTGTQGAWPAARGSRNNLGFGLKQQALQNLWLLPSQDFFPSQPKASPAPNSTLKSCKAGFQGSEPGCPSPSDLEPATLLKAAYLPRTKQWPPSRQSWLHLLTWKKCVIPLWPLELGTSLRRMLTRRNSESRLLSRLFPTWRLRTGSKKVMPTCNSIEKHAEGTEREERQDSKLGVRVYRDS